MYWCIGVFINKYKYLGVLVCFYRGSSPPDFLDFFSIRHPPSPITDYVALRKTCPTKRIAAPQKGTTHPSWGGPKANRSCDWS